MKNRLKKYFNKQKTKTYKIIQRLEYSSIKYTESMNKLIKIIQKLDQEYGEGNEWKH